MRPDALNSVNSTGANAKEFKAKNEVSPDGTQAVSNQLPPKLQVRASVKTEQALPGKVTAKAKESASLDDIASLISIIENSRKVSESKSEEPLFQMLPKLPQTEGQLIIKAADSPNVRKDELLDEVVQHFSQVDTDKDNLVSYDEVMAFINKD